MIHGKGDELVSWTCTTTRWAVASALFFSQSSLRASRQESKRIQIQEAELSSGVAGLGEGHSWSCCFEVPAVPGQFLAPVLVDWTFSCLFMSPQPFLLRLKDTRLD